MDAETVNYKGKCPWPRAGSGVAGAIADFGARAGAAALNAARGPGFPCAGGRAVRGDL